jgi:hypothetical protein
MQDSPSHRLRQADLDEELARIEVIFSRFVDHSKLMELLGLCVGQCDVNLSRFQGGFISRALDANDKLLGAFWHSIIPP